MLTIVPPPCASKEHIVSAKQIFAAWMVQKTGCTEIKLPIFYRALHEPDMFSCITIFRYRWWDTLIWKSQIIELWGWILFFLWVRSSTVGSGAGTSASVQYMLLSNLLSLAWWHFSICVLPCSHRTAITVQTLYSQQGKEIWERWYCYPLSCSFQESTGFPQIPF